MFNNKYFWDRYTTLLKLVYFFLYMQKELNLTNYVTLV